MHYAVWRACERLGIRPPDIKTAWDDCSVFAQAELIAFNQIREQEELARDIALAGGKQ